MQSRRSSRQQFVNGARVLIRELLREPIKEAVREGLREELAARDEEQLRIETDSSADGGGSRLPGLMMKLLAVGLVMGVAYYARQSGSDTLGSESSPEPVEGTGRETEFASGVEDS